MFFKIQGRVAAARCLSVLAGDAMRCAPIDKQKEMRAFGEIFNKHLLCVFI